MKFLKVLIVLIVLERSENAAPKKKLKPLGYSFSTNVCNCNYTGIVLDLNQSGCSLQPFQKSLKTCAIKLISKEKVNDVTVSNFTGFLSIYSIKLNIRLK